jgi:hypothetical protein
LSAVVETEDTVVAVVSVVVVLSEDGMELSVLAVLESSDFEHDETSTAMLAIKASQDNELFILILKIYCVSEIKIFYPYILI